MKVTSTLKVLLPILTPVAPGKKKYNFSSRVLSLHFPTDALPLHCKWCVGLFLNFSRLPSTHPPPRPLPDFAEFAVKGNLCSLHRNLPSVSFSVKSKRKAFIHIRFSPHPLYHPPFAILPVFAGMSLCAWAHARCVFVPKSNFTWSYYLYIHTWHSVCNGPIPLCVQMTVPALFYVRIMHYRESHPWLLAWKLGWSKVISGGNL